MCVILKSEAAEGTCKIMRCSGVVMTNVCAKILDPSGFKERISLHDRKVNNDRPIAILKRVDLYSVSHCLRDCSSECDLPRGMQKMFPKCILLLLHL